MSERDVSKYIPASWIKERMDEQRLTPTEPDHDLLTRLLDKGGSLRWIAGIFGCSTKPVKKLFVQEDIPILTQSEVGKRRWAQEKAKNEQGLPSLLDQTCSGEANKKRRASMGVYWDNEEGQERKEVNTGQIRARAKKDISNALGNNPQEALAKNIRRYGVTGTARLLGKSKGTIQRWAALFNVPTSMQYRPSRPDKQDIIEEASKSGQLSSLPPNYKAVLEERYLSEKSPTLTELGEKLEVSRQAVWQTERAAFRQLEQLRKSQED